MNSPQISAARFIGQRLPRKEDARLLTGRGTFVDDVVLPGMLHVAFVRSPIARGRIRSIDSASAREMPGVYAVLTAVDLDRLKVQMLSFFLRAVEVETPMLATDRVAYVGDPVAMVVAQDRYIAEDAASLVTVDYAEEEAVVSIEDAKHGPPVHPGTESNLAAAMGVEEDEDLEALLAKRPASGDAYHHASAHLAIADGNARRRRVQTGGGRADVSTSPARARTSLRATCPWRSACRRPTSASSPRTSEARSA